jgi:hypothetical protein
LGALITKAKAAGLLGDQVAEAFAVLGQRNWLIHNSMHEVSDSFYNDAQRELILERIRSLADQSLVLKKRLICGSLNMVPR